VYLVGSGLTAATAGAGAGWVAFLYATRFIAGMGIGGEYAAINAAIDEMIPARYRGRVDIGVNGTYWAGRSSAPGLAGVVDLDRTRAGLAARLPYSPSSNPAGPSSGAA
jgi:MFS family permease